jgi:hypothetical protein
MKTTQARIADLWCRLMHTQPMWPSHGQYECRTCGRRHQVCWEQPAPAAARARICEPGSRNLILSIVPRTGNAAFSGPTASSQSR